MKCTEVRGRVHGRRQSGHTVVHALRAGGHEAGDVPRGGQVGDATETLRANGGRGEQVAADIVPVGDDVVSLVHVLLFGDTARGEAGSTVSPVAAVVACCP